MKVVEYNGNHDIYVQFDRGNIVHTDWKAFCKGEVANVYDKTVYDVGYLGEGEYAHSEGGVVTSRYVTWQHMLSRCYNAKFQKNNETYKGCMVVEEWHNFQNFAKWYDENYYEVEGEVMCLDKDIIFKGNKVYSPDACVFVPNRLNVLVVNPRKKRGKLPVGVSYDKASGKYKAQVNIQGKYRNLGRFSTVGEAFTAYKKAKEEYIKAVAWKYSKDIPVHLFIALNAYEVDIND
ncbi:putative AP2 domain-containing protein [Bacillus phage PBC6]|nr:putative AP2 domain-containing protein [Bacillus phage PBC6]